MPAQAGGPYHSGQLIRAQDREGGRLSSEASQRKVAFHTHLFLLAQSDRDLVRSHPTGDYCPWDFYLGERSGSKADALHPGLLRIRQTLSLEVHQYPPSHHILNDSMRRSTSCMSLLPVEFGSCCKDLKDSMTVPQQKF